jgi:hypothetical protein
MRAQTPPDEPGRTPDPTSRIPGRGDDEVPPTPPTEPDPTPVQEPPDAPGSQRGPYIVG